MSSNTNTNTNTSLYFQPNELEDLFETLKKSPDRQNFKDEYEFFIWQCKQKTYARKKTPCWKNIILYLNMQGVLTRHLI